MCDFSNVRYNVYAKHPERGVELIGQGMSAKRAISLATNVFAKSKWTVDTQVVPVSALVHSTDFLQKTNVVLQEA